MQVYLWHRMLRSLRSIIRIITLRICRELYGPSNATVLLHPGYAPAATVIRIVGNKVTMVRMVIRPGTYVSARNDGIYKATEAGWQREDPPSRTEVISLAWLRSDDPALASYVEV